MTNQVAVNIEYWAYQENNSLVEPAGMAEFIHDLEQNYVARVRGRPGDLGGGLYELTIHVIASISVGDVVRLIADGIAFDLLKVGAKSFVFRPLFEAFRKLKDRSKEPTAVDVYEVQFIFNDTKITVSKLPGGSAFESLGDIFQALVQNFQSLKANGNEPPYEIHIPVFEDPSGEICRFRQLLDVDETIENTSQTNYLKFWGVRYDFSRAIRVFDVERKLLIDSPYLTIEEYWKAWEEKRRLNSYS